MGETATGERTKNVGRRDDANPSLRPHQPVNHARRVMRCSSCRITQQNTGDRQGLCQVCAALGLPLGGHTGTSGTYHAHNPPAVCPRRSSAASTSRPSPRQTTSPKNIFTFSLSQRFCRRVVPPSLFLWLMLAPFLARFPVSGVSQLGN